MCTEYVDRCDTLSCESNGEDVKADGACDSSGAVARCVCNDEGDRYTEYYFEGEIESLREECEFFCQTPTFEEL